MNATELYFRLVDAGVSLDVVDGQLKAWPADKIPSELIGPLRAHARELIERLDGRPSAARTLAELDQQRSRSFEPSRALRTVDGIPNPSLTGRWARYADVLACPHCHWMDLVEADGWLRCVACDRLAWRADEESIERVDHQGSTVLPGSPPLSELIRRQEETEMAERDRRMLTRLEAARKRSAEEATPLLPTIQDQ